MSNKLKAITRRAKQIYKPGKMKWTDAVKKASHELQSGKKKPAAKKAARKKAAHKKSFLSPSSAHPHKHWGKVKAHERRVSGVGSTKQHTLGIPRKVAEQLHEKLRCEEQIKALRELAKQKNLTANDRLRIRQSITYYQKSAGVAKKNLTNLKKLL